MTLATFFGILLLLAVLTCAYLISQLVSKPTAEELAQDAKTLEISRLELELRALEHKSKTAAYTSADAHAYALIIRRRNTLVPPPVVAPRVVKQKSYRAAMRIV